MFELQRLHSYKLGLTFFPYQCNNSISHVSAFSSSLSSKWIQPFSRSLKSFQLFWLLSNIKMNNVMPYLFFPSFWILFKDEFPETGSWSKGYKGFFWRLRHIPKMASKGAPVTTTGRSRVDQPHQFSFFANSIAANKALTLVWLIALITGKAKHVPIFIC